MKKIAFPALAALCVLSACDPKEPVEPPATYDPTPFNLDVGHFPAPSLPPDNPLTITGVQLGRMLFYEKNLSKDGSQACADCHKQKDAFTDNRQFSIGVEGLPGKRQAMLVMNLAWHRNSFFWDGRAALLRDQALMPIQDPLEMNETLDNVMAKLSADKRYTDQFIRAFGDATVTPERIALALEQFMFTVISNNSKYDQWEHGHATLTDSEERGRKLFFQNFDPDGTEKGAQCYHCHSGHNFTIDDYVNNGLDSDATLTDFGLENATHNPADRGKFKVPSLRNVALTAPYMHDGRFATLEEVINHYDHGVKKSATVDVLLQVNQQTEGLQLTEQDKADLVAFLKTLTDLDFIKNPDYQKPE
jgi:cytochrome c peroxidase